MLGAWLDGWRRVREAPAVWVGALAFSLLSTLPLTVIVHGALSDQLGSSLVADTMARGVDYEWWQEFTDQAGGVARTFTPTIIGFAASLDAWSRLLDGASLSTPLTRALAVYLGGWVVLSGGVIERYARRRPLRVSGFAQACGRLGGRLLRLALVAGAVYWVLFAVVHPWLFNTWYGRFTRDVAAESTALVWRALLYLVFGALVAATMTIVDYAKVRVVVEDRRSALLALVASLRFIARQPSRVAGLWALNSLALIAVLSVWAVAAPGVGDAGAGMWLRLLATQGYLAARLAIKLASLASATALFEPSSR